MRDAGFTLVEVLAALLIFSLAIVGLSRATTQSVAHTQRLTNKTCLLYTSPSPRDKRQSRMPSSA